MTTIAHSHQRPRFDLVGVATIMGPARRTAMGSSAWWPRARAGGERRPGLAGADDDRIELFGHG